MPIVLLIDDDPDFVEATRTVLESVPYKVVVAYDGNEGLAKAQEARPDLVILDVIMPMEDGFETLAKLRTDPNLAQVPVMMLTSLSNGLDMALTSDTDVVVEDYIGKPIRPAELLRRVERLLKLRNPQSVSRSASL